MVIWMKWIGIYLDFLPNVFHVPLRFWCAQASERTNKRTNKQTKRNKRTPHGGENFQESPQAAEWDNKSARPLEEKPPVSKCSEKLPDICRWACASSWEGANFFIPSGCLRDLLKVFAASACLFHLFVCPFVCLSARLSVMTRYDPTRHIFFT